MTTRDISCVSEHTPVSKDDLTKRVTSTPAARTLLGEIQAEYGDVMFHQSGGCCDGSSPMCYPKGDFALGVNDVKLGDILNAEVWISGSQYEVWKHTQLILDAVPGRGGMFSLDNGREQRFLTRSRVFTPAELDAMGIH